MSSFITVIPNSRSDLQEVQMAAVSSLSQVNTKIETQRSIITAKGLELHDLAIQLQALGGNTFGGWELMHAFGNWKYKALLSIYTFRTSPEYTGEGGKLFNRIFGNESREHKPSHVCSN